MANPVHLKILKRGWPTWNEWRKKHPDIIPDLSATNLTHIKLRTANLRGVDFSKSNLTEANLEGAYLSQADLSGVRLMNADLSAAQLDGARLIGAELVGSNLNFADLRGANLSLSVIGFVNFDRTKLDRAVFTEVIAGCTIFKGIDLGVAKKLESVHHQFPSSIDIETLSISEGRIPDAFLRGCGVPEEFIIYARSLADAAHPIQFYTCFISFTEADNTFSERLHDDLQAARVRCWRWKEDAKWGKSLMRSIDEAVRLYDKLIVICSEQSLNSPAVLREIERALQKEDEQARQGQAGEVLFPIRLDDYIFTGWTHHRKADVTAKNVGDFRQWKNHDNYQKAFDRLLRDLKASG